MPVWIFRFLGKYWKLLLIVIAIIAAYLYFQQTSDGWAKRYREIEASHKDEIAQIEKARETERKQHEENVKQLKSEMQLIQQKYDDQIKQLATKKRTVVKQIIEEHGDKPDELAEELSKVTGFKVKKIGE